MRNFSSEDRWGEKRKALAQQEAAVLYGERVENTTALCGDSSKPSNLGT